MSTKRASFNAYASTYIKLRVLCKPRQCGLASFKCGFSEPAIFDLQVQRVHHQTTDPLRQGAMADIVGGATMDAPALPEDDSAMLGGGGHRRHSGRGGLKGLIDAFSRCFTGATSCCRSKDEGTHHGKTNRYLDASEIMAHNEQVRRERAQQAQRRGGSHVGSDGIDRRADI